MALIVPHTSSATIQNASHPGPVAQSRSAGEFTSLGANLWPQALAKLAGGLGNLGQALHAQTVEAQELELLQDVQQFKKAGRQYNEEYVANKVGSQGARAGEEGAAWYEAQLGELQKKYQGRVVAEKYLTQHAVPFAEASVVRLGQYGRQQQEAWKDEVMLGEQAEFMGQAQDYNRSPEEVSAAFQSQAKQQYAYYLSKGLEPEAAAAQVDNLHREALRANALSRFEQLQKTSKS